MLEAVGADGYENTSVRTVLDRCGLYRQAFYDDFRDFLDTEPDVGRALIVEVHPAGEAALGKRDAAMWRAREVIDRGRLAALGAPEPAAIAAEAAAAGIHAVLHSRLAAAGVHVRPGTALLRP